MTSRWLEKIILMSVTALLLLVVLVGCEANKASNGANSSYVLVKELEFVNQSLEEKESGIYLYKGQIKNNSKYTIKGISIEIELDNHSYTTLATQDTLLSGETSAYIECFGPSSGNIEDMKATRITINMYDNEMRHTRIQYDVNQDQYTYTEDEIIKETKPSVLVTDLEFVNPTISEPNEEGNVSFKTSISNNSDYIITGLVYSFEFNDRKTINLVSLDSIGAHEMSSVLSCQGPDSGNIEEMQPKQIKYSIVDQDGNSQQITYDVRLGHYFIK